MDYRVARILRILIFVLIALVAIVLIIAAFNALRGAITGTQVTKTEAPKAINLNDYKTNGSSVRFVDDGLIEAPEQHTTTTITVSATQRVVEVSKGYNQPPVLSKAYPNNQASYSAFLDALSTTGFTAVKTTTVTNREGSCPLGSRYSYQVLSGGSLPQNSWDTSCGGKIGTFAGEEGSTQELFKLQIPEYDEVVSSVQ